MIVLARLLAAALVAGSLLPLPARGAGSAAALVSFSAPAGMLPAGHRDGLTYSAVLPSGRLLSPAGTSVVVGMNALGVALSPDGRYAIVSNDDEREADVRSAIDPETFGGYSLAVVDTAAMRVVSRYRAPGVTFFAGIVALPDPQQPARTLVFAAGGSSGVVYPLLLDAAGTLVPDRAPPIPIAGPLDPAFADLGRSFPVALSVAPGGHRVYVVNQLAGTVAAIDTQTRRTSGAQRPVGFQPSAIAQSGNRLLVTNEGLMRYGVLRAPAAAPPFLTPPADLARASSLSIVALGPGGDPATDPADAAPFVDPLPMDPQPDGIRTVGGAHPAAVVATPDGSYAFVAMAGVDRIATLALGAQPHVAGGTELRLFDRGPYGTQPAALALSRDGTRLYVALTGLNAVAVIDARDPLHLHRLGLIPTGWAPSALVLSADDRTLYVADAKGIGEDAGFTGDPTTGADSNAVWATLERIDLAAVRLADATRATLANTRRVGGASPDYPAAISRVVLIVTGSTTFDAVLGDLGSGPADPAFSAFGEAVTPNLHALARRFALAGNFFADAEEADGGQQFALAGIASAFTERTLPVRGGRRPLSGASQDPEDYPRAGYLFHALARHGINFRDYGGLLGVSGYDGGGAADPTVDDPAYRDPADTAAPTRGLGGSYAFDVPAPAVLDGHLDQDYPGRNPRIRDERRAAEFVRDDAALALGGRRPRFSFVWLPGTAGASGPRVPAPDEAAAAQDRAVGTIVAALSHDGAWRSTAIFIVPASAEGARDHVDEHRSYALVVSPYAKPHFVGMRHTSTAGVLKTIDGLLRVPPLSLGDLLATDLSDYFTARRDLRPFEAAAAAPPR